MAGFSVFKILFCNPQKLGTWLHSLETQLLFSLAICIPWDYPTIKHYLRVIRILGCFQRITAPPSSAWLLTKIKNKLIPDVQHFIWVILVSSTDAFWPHLKRWVLVHHPQQQLFHSHQLFQTFYFRGWTKLHRKVCFFIRKSIKVNKTSNRWLGKIHAAHEVLEENRVLWVTF